MNDRSSQIKDIVKKYYLQDKDLKPEDEKFIIQKIVDRYSNDPISLEELAIQIQTKRKRQKNLEEIRKNYYKQVLSIERVAESIGKVPTDVLEDFLIEYSYRMNELTIEEIITAAVERFKVYRNIDINLDHQLPIVIEKELNGDKIKEILTSVLSNPTTAGEHNFIALDGTFLSANIIKNNAVIGFVTSYMIIHQGLYEMDKLYEELKNNNINEMTSLELNEFFAQVIVRSVQERLGLENVTSPENKQQIATYVYTNYIQNGYCFQGTNSRFRQDIEEKGISTEFSRTTDNDLQIVDQIFKNHGLSKIFYSKLSETAEAPYFYTTDNMEIAYHYSYHNPEYFSYFVASGNNMPDGSYNKTAYYLRNSEQCRNNLKTLCRHYHLTPEEQQIVMSTYEKLAAELMTTASNTVTFISRKLVNKDNIPIDLTNISDRSIESIISEIMANREENKGTKHNLSIPSDKIDVISVPSLDTFYDASKLSTWDTRKYIPLEDGSKYYYDIILNADQIDYDCITVSAQPPTLTTIKSRDSINKTTNTIDIISCPKTIGKDSLLNNGSPSFQSLQMMIAVNGTSNSPEGEELLSLSRQNYSPQYMSNYYYHLCDLCCQAATDKDLPLSTRCQAILRMAKDFYPKAEQMRITGDYPAFISEEKHLVETLSYYDYLQVKGIENIKNGIQTKEQDTLFERCANIYCQKIEGKVEQSFKQEFDKKMDLYGTKKILDKKKDSQLSTDIPTPEQQSTLVRTSSSKLSSMFAPQKTEEPSAKTSKVQTTEKTKVKTYLSGNSQSPQNNKGITNSLNLILILVVIVSIIILLIKFA